MKKAKLFMKSANPKIGIRKAKSAESTKGLGIIKFGKSRLDKTRYMMVDIQYDDKTGDELFKAGPECLQHDKEAVINYLIVKALKYTAEFQRVKCKKSH